ncbi:MAG: hypothetical protein VX185_13665 [Pseudomonadota bacterium]|nr:hypothetical protein [Pseudomonadota bacterium]
MPRVQPSLVRQQITAKPPAAFSSSLNKVQPSTATSKIVPARSLSIKSTKPLDFLKSIQNAGIPGKQLQHKIAYFKSHCNTANYLYEVKAPLTFDKNKQDSLLYRKDEEIALHLMLSDQFRDAALYRAQPKKPSPLIPPYLYTHPGMTTPITVMTSRNIRMSRFELNIMNTSKAKPDHQSVTISAAGNKCWMRTAWLSIFSQIQPEAFLQRLKGLGIDGDKYKTLLPLIKATQSAQYNQVLTGHCPLSPFELPAELKLPDDKILLKSSQAESLIKELTQDIIIHSQAYKNCKTDKEKALLLDPVQKDVFGSDDIIFLLADAMNVPSVLFNKATKHTSRSLQILDSNQDLIDKMVAFDKADRADSASAKLRSMPIIVHDQNHFNILLPVK